MGTRSVLGGQRAPKEPRGRDAGSLGPSDSSDSGSDMTGVDREEGDPNQPVDVAMQGDATRPLVSGDILDGGPSSDAAGTGERRSAGSDAGPREAPDISTDRIVDVGRTAGEEQPAEDEEADPDLAFMDDDEEGDDEADAGERAGDEPRRPGDPQRTKT
ncbi:hypothetical protein [Caldimonas sp. KR1-144]|uniref:hypothetical protein n=1 Tax=Caldimonas sp. KR1-144 TaxID=3400911 RepID=UPI003C0E5FF4